MRANSYPHRDPWNACPVLKEPSGPPLTKFIEEHGSVMYSAPTNEAESRVLETTSISSLIFLDNWHVQLQAHISIGGLLLKVLRRRTIRAADQHTEAENGPIIDDQAPENTIAVETAEHADDTRYRSARNLSVSAPPSVASDEGFECSCSPASLLICMGTKSSKPRGHVAIQRTLTCSYRMRSVSWRCIYSKGASRAGLLCPEQTMQSSTPPKASSRHDHVSVVPVVSL